MGTAPSSTDLSAIKTICKTSPSDSLLFQVIFTMVYTWSSWFWMISARQIFKFRVRTGNDSVMVHPASLTSLLISSLISPLKPPFYSLTTVVLLCSPIVTGKHWSTRINREAEGTHIMLNISISRKYKRFARKTDSTDLHVFWLHARLTQTHADHNASVQIFCRREPIWLSCVVSRAQLCLQNDLPVIDKNWVDLDIVWFLVKQCFMILKILKQLYRAFMILRSRKYAHLRGQVRGNDRD